jgi:hypothetical protein
VVCLLAVGLLPEVLQTFRTVRWLAGRRIEQKTIGGQLRRAIGLAAEEIEQESVNGRCRVEGNEQVESGHQPVGVIAQRGKGRHQFQMQVGTRFDFVLNQRRQLRLKFRHTQVLSVQISAEASDDQNDNGMAQR